MSSVLIKNADWILTMDASDTRLKNADVLVVDNQIRQVGVNLSPALKPDEVIDATGRILIPGFVNTHHHTFQSLVRNFRVFGGLKLEEWLAAIYRVFEYINQDVARAGTLVGLGELLKTGCTTSQDHFYAHPNGQSHLIDVQIEAAKELGIRFHPTRGGLTIGKSNGSPHVPDSLVETTDALLYDYERLVGAYHDADRFSMCRVGVSPCWPEFETREILVETRKFAKKNKVYCHTHLAESYGEFAYCKEKFGCTPVEFLQELDWLGEDCYFAHCVQLTDSDVQLMAKTGSGVAHCPISNMFINNDVCRIPDLMAAKASLSLGVDGAASSNSSSMMQEIRSCYLIHQQRWGKRGPQPYDVLRMATAGGAKVLGRDDIGMIAPGMAADLVLLDWDQFQFAGGKNDPACCIVMSGDATMVETVLVNGKVVVRDRKLTTIDERQTRDWVNKVGRDLIDRASVSVSELIGDLY